MSTRFTRVTVIGPAARIDAAMSRTAPVALLLPQVLPQVAGPAAGLPATWQLTLLDGTALSPDASLADAGITDGQILLLADDPAPPLPPRVTDLVEAAEQATTARRGAWTTTHTRRTVRIALAAAATLTAVVQSFTGSGITAAATCALPLLILLALLAARRADSDVAWWLAAALPLAAGTADAGLRMASDHPPVGWRLLVAVGAPWCVALLARAMSRHVTALLIGATTVALPLAAAGTALGAGLPADRVFGVLALACLLLLGVFPRLAIDASGLSTLEDTVADGQVVPMAAVTDATGRAARYTTAALWGTALPAAAALIVLSAGGRVIDQVYAAVLAAAFALRSRAFSVTVHLVAPLLVAATGAAVLTARLVTGGQAWLPPVVAVAVIGALASGALWRPSAIAARKIARLAGRLEAVAVTACPVLLVAVCGGYDLIAAHTFIN